jgi:hypothetical protein
MKPKTSNVPNINYFLSFLFVAGFVVLLACCVVIVDDFLSFGLILEKFLTTGLD